MPARFVLSFGCAAALLLGACGTTPSADPADAALVAAGEVDPPPVPSPIPTTPPLPALSPTAEAGPTPVDIAGGQGIRVPEATPVDRSSEPTPAAEPPSSPTVLPAAPTAGSTPGPDPTPSPAVAATATPGIATAGPVTSVPTATDRAVDVANGAEVYSINCARCHSENGLGTFQASGLIGIGGTSTRDGLIAELTNGHPVTFGFGDKLSSAEIAAVVSYVRATF